MKQRLVLPVLAACLTGPVTAQVPTPEEHLGRPVGRDFELADWDEVSGYFRRLGAASPRVLCETVGTTTEGREFLLATISSEENLGRLDELRGIAGRLADPRGLTPDEEARCLRDGRVILFIASAMHATEVAAPQFTMEFAHALATSDEEPWRSARENCVVLIAPSLNPDGQDHVVSWYRETVGTPYETTGLLKLYQLYAGHDNNRDWFMLSLDETRIVTELLYSKWHPQVYWDVHQQGSSGERFFVPPFRDPLNPNLEPVVIAGIDELGTRALFDMTRWGFTGIATGVSYDMWWNGGNRNVPVRHNIVGLLTEAASCRLATPIFQQQSSLSGPRRGSEYVPHNNFPDPWPGGWWRIRDILDYEYAFGKSLVGSLARERELWLDNALRAARNSMATAREHGPFAWLIPSDNEDPEAVRRFVDTLLLGGVEVHAARADFEADGRPYPAGTLVLSSDQPYAQHVKDLCEVQRYPAGDPPYDVAGWTLPLLLGIRRVEVKTAFEAELERVRSVDEALASFSATRDGTFQVRDGASWKAYFRGDTDRLGRGERAFATLPLGETRVGLYTPWSGSMDEGWTRWVFDEFGVPYTRVRNEMIRAGNLREILDVLVIPSISSRQLDRGRSPGSIPAEYERGLDPEGAIAVEEFVEAGGRLVCFGSSASWAVDLLRLPLKDVTSGDEGEGFSCPGSVLRGVPHGERSIVAGLPASIPLFFSRSSAWRELDSEEREGRDLRALEFDEQVLLTYAPTRLLLSGYVEKPEVVEGRAAWIRADVGDGEVHLFGFRPQYRSWTQGTFHLLFRAMFAR